MRAWVCTVAFAAACAQPTPRVPPVTVQPSSTAAREAPPSPEPPPAVDAGTIVAADAGAESSQLTAPGASELPQEPPPDRAFAPSGPALTDACRGDSDCVISTSGGCCSPCQGSPYAESLTAQQKERSICAVVDCTAGPIERCPPAEPATRYRAVCRAGTCQRVKEGER